MKLENWQVGQYGKEIPDHTCPGTGTDMIPAAVPGCVQYDLMRAGRLKNPYASTKHALESAWVARSDWLYECSFDVPDAVENHKNVIVKLHGVDTFSEVWLNGRYLGETDSAYCSYEWQVGQKMLAAKGNRLQIRIKSHDRMIQEKKAAAECLKREGGTEGLLGKSLIRRYQRSFFTTSSLLNIGTGVLGIGINRPVEICFYPGAYITDVSYVTERIEKTTENCAAKGYMEIALHGTEKDTQVHVKILDMNGTCVWKTDYEAKAASQRVYTEILNPKLWWPVGYGTPYLYTALISIWQEGKKTDEQVRKIGIRTVQVIKRTEDGKKTFYIAVNGKRIYIRGQNYIPLDYLKVYGTKRQYEEMFLLLEKQHVNLIRIWGGGAVEEESFFEECDTRGILIWHDLFLHSNVYPDYDPEFVRGFLKETEGVIKTIRSHPSICLICGGNEQFEGWDEYGWQQEMQQFYGSSLPLKYIPDMVKELCPEIPYICNSPYGGRYAQSPVEGDCHCWGNYYNAFKDPLFVSETCWTGESYSRLETLKKYMDLNPEEFEGLGWGQKWRERTSLELIGRRPYSSWFDVSSLKGYLHGLEVEQARADYVALSQLRFCSPSNHGIIYWSFNKGGPLFQFGCVDYGGYPMMSYYVVQRLYSDVAIFPYRDVCSVRIMLSNHLGCPVTITLEAFHMNEGGDLLKEYRAEVVCGTEQAVMAMTIKDLYREVCDRTKETLFVRAWKEGRVISEDLLLFCPYGELDIVRKPVHVDIEKSGEMEWNLTLWAEGIIQMAEVESNGKIVCDDNYFPMMPGEKKCVKVTGIEAPECGKEWKLFIGQLGTEGMEEIRLEQEEQTICKEGEALR